MLVIILWSLNDRDFSGYVGIIMLIKIVLLIV